MSKYMTEKWERKRDRMVHVLWNTAKLKNESSEEQTDVGGLC